VPASEPCCAPALESPVRRQDGLDTRDRAVFSSNGDKNMNHNADVLQELIQLARDGAVFYADAAREVKDPTLVPLFNRMATAKRELISALGGQLERTGEVVSSSGTFGGSLRKTYTEVLAKLSSNDGKVYVDQLEQSEDRLLEHFDDAIAGAESVELRAQLTAHLPAVRATHDEMRRVKKMLAAA